MHNPSLYALFLYTILWVIGIYAINCLIAREIKRFNLTQGVLHFLALAMIGLLGETFVGTLYHRLFHKALWQYTLYPIHHAYTSKYSIFVWGFYGIHLYLLHGTLRRKKITATYHLSLLFCAEAIFLEAAVNITYKLCFGNYIFYYYPTDLWHFTSVQTLPAYLIAGYGIVKLLRRFELRPRLFSAVSLVVIIVAVLLH